MVANAFTNERQAIADLECRGFGDSFQAQEDGLKVLSSGEILRPEEVEIVEFHRFEGKTNPDDMSVVYGIKGKDRKGKVHKGIIVDAFGAYAEPALGELIERIHIRDRKEQQTNRS